MTSAGRILVTHIGGKCPNFHAVCDIDDYHRCCTRLTDGIRSAPSNCVVVAVVGVVFRAWVTCSSRPAFPKRNVMAGIVSKECAWRGWSASAVREGAACWRTSVQVISVKYKWESRELEPEQGPNGGQRTRSSGEMHHAWGRVPRNVTRYECNASIKDGEKDSSTDGSSVVLEEKVKLEGLTECVDEETEGAEVHSQLEDMVQKKEDIHWISQGFRIFAAEKETGPYFRGLKR
ncbi:hypothetical protein H4582DRAFT_1948302 [Lactarius indigo]|nr:hypothetical protein H4582DRAFT_1948302 [Lactarius indigo]